MFKFPDPFALFTLRRILRINVFVWKWVIRLLSASIEICLRRNFGRRYLNRLLAGAFFCTVCAALSPESSPLTGALILTLYALAIYHGAAICARSARGAPEPHSFFTGNSWAVWRRLPCGEAAVQRYFEPAICVLAGLTLKTVDPFLYGWLACASASLFVKGQIGRFQEARRLLDALDAKHQAQALNAALAARQHGQAQAAQHSHQARIPGFSQRRNP